MDFRDFEVKEHDDNTIVISQNNDCGEDKIFLDKKQISLFIESLTGSKPYYLADLYIDQDSIDDIITIESPNLEDLYSDKKFFYETYIEDMENIPCQRDQTELKRIRKVIDITGDL